jgi:Uma2 family endonuclease
MMLTQERVYSAIEYLALEENAEVRNEFINGEIVPMAGGTTQHNELVTNLCLCLKPQMRKRGGKVYTENVKLKIPDFNIFTYPDVMIIAGEPIYEENSKTTILNPAVIFEVLSPATKDYDQGRKFEFYRSVTSLKDYILIDQERCSVMVYQKTDAHEWKLRILDNINANFILDSVGIELNLADIYEDIYS